MTQTDTIPADQEEMFGITQKTHAEALKSLTEALTNHCKVTGQTPTNAMQFAAIDGFMAASGQVLAAMTVDTVQGDNGITEERVLEGSIGALFMFQKTLENIFAETLNKANMEGVDVRARLKSFQEEYELQKTIAEL